MKKEKRIRCVLSVIVSLYILLLSGCWSVTPKPPLVPPVINAKLPAYRYAQSLNWTDSNDYDAKVLFYIDYSVQYAQKNHWSATSEWYIYKLNKIETVEGQFDEDEISFLCTISFSKPGSWMHFSPFPIQYKRRMVLQLGLKKQKGHYEIVSQQQKSWLAPYGELVKPEQVDNFKEIINSVCLHLNVDQADFEEKWQIWLKNYARSSELAASIKDEELRKKEQKMLCNHAILSNIGNIEIVDENDESYVIYILHKNTKEEHLLVNKTTLDISGLPVPEKY